MRRLLAMVLMVVLSGPVMAEEAAWEALAEPGTAALMRHATAPGIGDPPGFQLEDCATQRNIDASGRAEAEAFGEALRHRGIRIDRVLTSRWCRARDTARALDVAPVEDAPALDSFFADRSSEPEQTAAVRALLTEAAPAEKVILVTHQVNITALTGRGAASGEIIVVEPTPGGLIVRGRIPAPKL